MSRKAATKSKYIRPPCKKHFNFIVELFPIAIKEQKPKIEEIENKNQALISIINQQFQLQHEIKLINKQVQHK